MAVSDPKELRHIVAPDEARALTRGTYHDPFALLGPRVVDDTTYVVAHVPLAARVWAVNDETSSELATHPDAPGVFVGEAVPFYRLRARWADGGEQEWEDPYRCTPVIGDLDEHLFGEGRHFRLWDVLGAHLVDHDGLPGVHFAVWAPNARRVSLVGDLNGWDGRRHPMRPRGATGIWELFVPGLREGAVYKYEIIGPDGTRGPLKADPVGFGAEHPPRTGSVVRPIDRHRWHDEAWLADRRDRQRVGAPVSIYEVHLGSWRRTQDGRSLSYLELAEQLVDYVADMGFTHVEVMPVSEFPFEGSWGYQPVGLYAPTVRHGTPEEFAALVDAAHARGIGVIVDWVPAHFPTDEHGLGQFDGTALYEHADPREGFHRDWNTLIYNYGRREVANYLVANALYWLDVYHVDGIRVDAVASMLYRDYSRQAGEWIPNAHGGRENLEAIEMLKELNTEAYGRYDGIMTVAEESTAFPAVSRPVDAGGLGFGYKWNIGWMNDALSYLSRPPVHRKYHHDLITFGLAYAFSENFVLPISHDEVVHGKGSMFGKIPGSDHDRLATLRAFYTYMWTHPGKKLLFMGQEFAQRSEWAYERQLDWGLVDDPRHAGVRSLVRDLNGLYRSTPALSARDAEPGGFQWLVVDDGDASVFAWVRWGNPEDPPVVVAVNFTPVDRPGYLLGFPRAGRWRVALDSDSRFYGGDDRPVSAVTTAPKPTHGQDQSALVDLPGLSAIVYVFDGA